MARIHIVSGLINAGGRHVRILALVAALKIKLFNQLKKLGYSTVIHIYHPCFAILSGRDRWWRSDRLNCTCVPVYLYVYNKEFNNNTSYL